MPVTYDARTARTWAEVDLGQVGRNARALRRSAGGAEVMAVVKADAYGHGAVRIARECARAGIAHFGVASVAEAMALRQAGIRQDIYTFSPFLPAEAEAIVRAELIPMLSSREQWDALSAAAAQTSAPLPARCFLKVDTGMGRSGCLPEEGRALWRIAARSAHLRIVGIATHFSSADEPDPAPTEAQLAVFTQFIRSLPAREAGEGHADDGLWLSCANSPASLRFAPPDIPDVPGIRGHLIRTGLTVYGIEPYRRALEGTELAPVLAWKARITLLRDLPAGATVGYGRTHTLSRPSRIATLAAGYADGLPRRLSNRGHILLHGRRLPIIGRVSMDQCQVDVTDAPEVRLGDAATVIGADGDQSQTILDLAEQIDTTSHEIPCALSRRVPRLYVRT